MVKITFFVLSKTYFEMLNIKIIISEYQQKIVGQIDGPNCVNFLYFILSGCTYSLSDAHAHFLAYISYFKISDHCVHRLTRSKYTSKILTLSSLRYSIQKCIIRIGGYSRKPYLSSF